jgi:hypothetical protein
MRVLSLCTSAGLWDKAFLEAGFDVVPGCEIAFHKRQIYIAWCGAIPWVSDIANLPAAFLHDTEGGMPSYNGIVGGIPCQSRSKTRAMRPPKFGDLLPQVKKVLDSCLWQWAIFENVAPLDIPGFHHIRLDAMNFGQAPFQSRPRWFTYCGLTPPKPDNQGTVDSLMAYPGVAGRLYGPKRGAILQGWPSFASLPFKCSQLQEALADGVPRVLADAWIRMITRSEAAHAVESLGDKVSD